MRLSLSRSPHGGYWLPLLLVFWLRVGPIAATVPAARVEAQSQLTGGVPAAVTPIGPYYALLIGNDEYQSMPRLKTATNDAKSIARLLRDQYGFSTSLLLNATRGEILDALSTYRRKLPINSNLLIYYAGHGTNDSEAKVAYWLPVDAQANNTANWISAEDITAELRVIRSLHVLIIADSCYSGALMRSSDMIDIDAELKPSERDYYIEKLQRIKSRNIMASGGKEPVADGGSLGHSIFAAVILQSLREMDAPEFTTSSLFQKVVVRVAGRSQQTPQYNGIVNSQHDGGDFVFIKQPGVPTPAEICCSQQSAAVPAVGPARRPPGDHDLDSQAVIDVLAAYKSSYESQDASQFKSLWAGIAPERVKALQDFFATAKSVTLSCTLVGSPEIGPSSATLIFTEQLAYSLDGKAKQYPPHRTTMKLIKQTTNGDTSWKIESMK